MFLVASPRKKIAENRMPAVAFPVRVITLPIIDADVESARPASHTRSGVVFCSRREHFAANKRPRQAGNEDMPMRIAFTHNLQMSQDEDNAEFDTPATIEAISEALRALGHDVYPVEVSGPASRLVARLETLHLGGDNELTVLPGSFLSGCSSLDTLHLGGNDLTVLPDSFLSGCSSLETLNLAFKLQRARSQPF